MSLVDYQLNDMINNIYLDFTAICRLPRESHWSDFDAGARREGVGNIKTGGGVDEWVVVALVVPEYCDRGPHRVVGGVFIGD